MTNKQKELDSIRFAKYQLACMLKDRPSMSIYVAPEDDLSNLVVEYFAGKTTGHVVTWINHDQSQDLPKYYLGGHRAHVEKGICQLYVKERDENGNKLKPERMWSIVIFEFNNLTNQKQWQRIGKLALSGNLTRVDYIKMFTYAEYQSIEETIKFYENLWIPHVKEKNLRTDPLLWTRGYKPSYNQWIAQYQRQDYYPFDSFGKDYDEVVVPYLVQNKIPIPK